ncbi:endoribonuclease YbeY [Cytophagales bacterium WSM2-2]|nr:endoribonuclease YbeY [Cytophagales bacterium WSM2-2]
MPIRFFSEEIDFKVKNPRKISQWLSRSAKNERREIAEISFIFCSDGYLLNLNQEYLHHNTLTDIITFDYSAGKSLVGDIYISVDRVSENASSYQSGFDLELKRVMIHGVLHLCGYKDKKPSDVTVMRKKEGAYLSLWKNMFHVKPKASKEA